MHTWSEKSVKRVLAIALITILGLIIAWSLLPYAASFFSAFVLYVSLQPLQHFLVHKLRLPRIIATIISIIASIVVIIVPLLTLITITIDQVRDITHNKVFMQDTIEYVDNYVDTFFPQIDISQELSKQASQIANITSNILLRTTTSLNSMAIELIITYFVLYFLLTTREENLMSIAQTAIPFNRVNTRKLVIEFRSLTYSILLSTVLIAIIQGILLTMGFLFFGVAGAYFWGVITVIFAILPVVGTALVWAPASIFAFLQQDYYMGFGILLWGAFLSNIDNVIRPYIQNKLGNIHPLTSLLGIIFGLPLFGLVGLVVGPLLISYFLLTVRMFREEYVTQQQ